MGFNIAVLVLYDEFPSIQDYLHELHIEIDNPNFEGMVEIFLELRGQARLKENGEDPYKRINPITKKDKDKIAKYENTTYKNMVKIESEYGALGFESYLEKGYINKPMADWVPIIVHCKDFTYFAYALS